MREIGADIARCAGKHRCFPRQGEEFLCGVFSYHADFPPSATKLWPVIKDDASEHKKITTPLYSPTCAMRPSMLWRAYASTNSFGCFSVCIPPGENAFTRTS